MAVTLSAERGREGQEVKERMKGNKEMSPGQHPPTETIEKHKDLQQKIHASFNLL